MKIYRCQLIGNSEYRYFDSFEKALYILVTNKVRWFNNKNNNTWNSEDMHYGYHEWQEKQKRYRVYFYNKDEQCMCGSNIEQIEVE